MRWTNNPDRGNKNDMVETQIKELLEAGVHFGHQASRWNPKMRRYIFAERNGIHIIDLKKTSRLLDAAKAAVRDITLEGDRVLFVCTKRQLRPIVEQIRRLKDLERGIEEGSFEFYTKKEQLLLERERQKLDKYLVGVKDMARVPGAVFVVDARKEQIAVREANKLEIPVIAITDTNADPDMIDYPIPGNDDAIRSVSVITGAIADAVEQARRELPPEVRRRAEEAEAVTYSTEGGVQEAERAERPRKRPRRRRRPRPEAIAQARSTGEDSEEEAGEE
jgi:small subunit ribosomal protein S2